MGAATVLHLFRNFGEAPRMIMDELLYFVDPFSDNVLLERKTISLRKNSNDLDVIHLQLVF